MQIRHFLTAFIIFFGISLEAGAVCHTSEIRDTVYIHTTDTVIVYVDSSAVKPTEDFIRKPVFAFRTNLLAPLVNVGVQIPMGNRMSLGFDWYYPFPYRNWAPFLRQQNCFQALSAGIDLRCYLGSRHERGSENWQYRLSGHSLGIFGYCGRYDAEWNYTGYQGNFINAGLDYTWSARIGRERRLRLDLCLGIGYFLSRNTEYRVYQPDGDAYRTGKTDVISYIGPNKLAVSLVIPINEKVRRAADE